MKMIRRGVAVDVGGRAEQRGLGGRDALVGVRGRRVIEGRNCRAVELQTAQGRHVVMFRSDEEAGAMEAGELRSDAKIFAACVASGGQRTGSLEVR